MNKDLWTFNEKGEIYFDSDANDYYYQWVSLDVAGKDLMKLFDEFDLVGNIRVKAREGAIFIVKEGDKDDTDNPPNKL